MNGAPYRDASSLSEPWTRCAGIANATLAESLRPSGCGTQMIPPARVRASPGQSNAIKLAESPAANLDQSPASRRELPAPACPIVNSTIEARTVRRPTKEYLYLSLERPAPGVEASVSR